MTMSSPKTSIPKVQTNDRDINQLQQNLIDGISRIQQSIYQSASGIGESRTAYITVAQFNQQAGPGWVPEDGRSCVGSTYEKLTGETHVPTGTPPVGAILMIRIN